MISFMPAMFLPRRSRLSLLLRPALLSVKRRRCFLRQRPPQNLSLLRPSLARKCSNHPVLSYPVGRLRRRTRRRRLHLLQPPLLSLSLLLLLQPPLLSLPLLRRQKAGSLLYDSASVPGFLFFFSPCLCSCSLPLLSFFSEPCFSPSSPYESFRLSARRKESSRPLSKSSS